MEKKQSQRARKIFGTFAKNWKNRKNPGRRKDKKKQVRNLETCFLFCIFGGKDDYNHYAPKFFLKTQSLLKRNRLVYVMKNL